jgi:hypothetical protein
MFADPQLSRLASYVYRPFMEESVITQVPIFNFLDYLRYYLKVVLQFLAVVLNETVAWCVSKMVNRSEKT